ncbi:MAG: hypothetical protein E4H14_14530 [Candidatus Thorarchaeota archaeon]|nr:MAG: hypothetical protein E4H14_14530 [Candidatus Thorarchaeota archaeon]
MNSGKSTSRFRKRYSMGAGEITLLLLFVMFFLPYLIDYRGVGSRLIAGLSSLTWRFLFFNDGTIEFRLELHFVANLPYIFLKYLFLFQFYRFYKGSTTEKYVLIVGLLSELQWFLMLGLPKVLEVLLGLRAWTSITSYIPIPISLVTAILLMILAPRPGSEPMWIDKEEKKSWWKSRIDAEDTSQEPTTHSFRSRIELISANLRNHPITSMIIIGLFIVYLPFVYQIHLDMIAAKVNTIAGMYMWRYTGCSLFPIPVDYSWFGVVAGSAYTQLSPIEGFIYTYFYLSLFARVIWSVMWLTFGIIYIINPLLKSSDDKMKNGAQGEI